MEVVCNYFSFFDNAPKMKKASAIDEEFLRRLGFEVHAWLFRPVGDGRPAAAVGAEPSAVHEEIAVVRPEAVERLAGENPAVAPLRRRVEFLAPVAAVRLAFREGTAEGGEVAEGREEPARPRAWRSVPPDDTHCDRHENRSNKSKMQFSPQQMRFLWWMSKSLILYPQFHPQNAGCVRR